MRIIIFSLILFATIGFIPRAGFAQANPTRDQSPSGERARQVLAEALTALGGLERLRSISSIKIKTKGLEHRSAEVQGYHPEKQTSSDHEEIIVAYPSQAKFAYEHRTGRHDGTYRWRRWMLSGDERVVADFVADFAVVGRNATVATERARRARRVSHLLILEAAENAATLHSAGSSAYEGRKHDVLEFQPANEKIAIRLFFDAETHMLSKYEYLTDFAGLGDAMIETVYLSYKKHPHLGWFPSGDVIKVAGRVQRRVDYTQVEVNEPRAAESFKLPDHLIASIIAAGTPLEIAKGVYTVQIGSYYPMFIEFRDFVLAVEAPAAWAPLENTPADTQTGTITPSETFIQKIKETIPNKPIKYVVATHFHSDHAGGARAFMAEGATILTTPGDKRLYEKMAAASHTIIPDRFAREPKSVNIETFDKRRVISDGERIVELINVGPNPHTEESVVAYIPKEKFLFQGDLFYFDGEASFPPKDRLTIMPFFAKWLKNNNLTPARIYGFHYRGFTTMKHVEQVLKMNAN